LWIFEDIFNVLSAFLADVDDGLGASQVREYAGEIFGNIQILI
jgi:hypothetical protein